MQEFQLQTTEKGSLTVEVSSDDFDPKVTIEKIGETGKTEMVGEDDDSGILTYCQLVFAAEAGGLYRVLVSSSEDEGGRKLRDYGQPGGNGGPSACRRLSVG